MPETEDLIRILSQIAHSTFRRLPFAADTGRRYCVSCSFCRTQYSPAGIFMTDWDTTSSRRCTAEGCIQAGNDLLMPGSRREYSALLCALRDGRLDRRLLRSCAGRIIKTALGLSAPTAP